MLHERLQTLQRSIAVQIFATDVNERSIRAARIGLYPQSVAADISPERLNLYFERKNDLVRVKNEIRELVIFAPHNVLEDPPFANVHLISCRNLLIYLDTPLQQSLLARLHYALKPGGILLLGSSETVGTASALFQDRDKRCRLFHRRAGASPAIAHRRGAMNPLRTASGEKIGAAALKQADLSKLADTLLLAVAVPPALLVNEHGDVLHVHGRVGSYLEHAAGPQGSVSVLNMAREGLHFDLMTAIRQAARGNACLRRSVRVRTNGDFTLVDVRAIPVAEPEALRGLILVTFSAAAATDAGGTGAGRTDAGGTDVGLLQTEAGRFSELEQELLHVRASHRRIVEEFEVTAEELVSTNEQQQATYEGLQSANEELETTKEEMQSLNEELQTVNAELEHKLAEFSHAGDDFDNMLQGTRIAALFLASDLTIRRFTKNIADVIRILPTDLGRPIGDIVSRLDYATLEIDARTVLHTLAPRALEVQGADGAQYQMRMVPYHTHQNVIDGLVVTFLDISASKRDQRQAQTAGQLATALLESSADALVIVDQALLIVTCNQRMRDALGNPAPLIGQRLDELGTDVFDTAALRALLRARSPTDGILQDVPIRFLCGPFGPADVLVSARPISSEPQESAPMLLTFRRQSADLQPSPAEGAVP